MKNSLLFVSSAGLFLSACATKGYQIAAPLSDAAAENMSCRALSIELAEVDETELAIKKEAKTDIRSVGAFLMDFGIGNSMAKGRAEEALAERRSAINSAMIAKNCAGHEDVDEDEEVADETNESVEDPASSQTD